MKYDYVIFGNTRDYFAIMFKDSIEKGLCEYISDPILNQDLNSIIKTIYKIHHNSYLNWRWDFPLKKLWFPLYYNVKRNKPVCFIFLMNWLKPQYTPLFENLRKKYKDCKIVAYLEDLVSSRPQFNLDVLKEFDCVITYDDGDALRYGFYYHPTFLSKLEIPEVAEEKRDVSFVGVAKDRTDEIYEVYDHLHNNGIITDFIISRLPPDKEKKSDMMYLNKDISYRDYLSHIVNSNCILEIMHHNAGGFSLRTWEALLYNKKLITNNKNILKAPFYRPDQFIYYENPSDIPVLDLKNKLPSTNYNNENISSIKFLEFVDNIL